MRHDAEDEDNGHASKQSPWGDLLSQGRQLRVGAFGAVSAEDYLVHESYVFVVCYFFVCIMSIPGSWACGLDIFVCSVPRIVQPLPSDLCEFQTLSGSVLFQLYKCAAGEQSCNKRLLKALSVACRRSKSKVSFADLDHLRNRLSVEQYLCAVTGQQRMRSQDRGYCRAIVCGRARSDVALGRDGTPVKSKIGLPRLSNIAALHAVSGFVMIL